MIGRASGPALLLCLVLGGLILGFAVALSGKPLPDVVADIDEPRGLHLCLGEPVDEAGVIKQLGSGGHQRIVEPLVELADGAMDVAELTAESQLAAKLLGIERSGQHAGVFDADLDRVFHEGSTFISHLHVALGFLGGEPYEEVQRVVDGGEASVDRGELRLCQRLGFVDYGFHSFVLLQFPPPVCFRGRSASCGRSVGVGKVVMRVLPQKGQVGRRSALGIARRGESRRVGGSHGKFRQQISEPRPSRWQGVEDCKRRSEGRSKPRDGAEARGGEQATRP